MIGRALLAGAVGALALTAANELGRRTLRAAPRLDLLGARAVARLTGRRTRPLWPGRRARHRRAALAGDLAANTLYYALAARGGARPPLGRGLWLGLLAGAGAVVLGPRLGLGHRPSDATVGTAGLTMAWYGLGGLAAALAARALAPPPAPTFSPAYA